MDTYGVLYSKSRSVNLIVIGFWSQRFPAAETSACGLPMFWIYSQCLLTVSLWNRAILYIVACIDKIHSDPSVEERFECHQLRTRWSTSTSNLLGIKHARTWQASAELRPFPRLLAKREYCGILHCNPAIQTISSSNPSPKHLPVILLRPTPSLLSPESQVARSRRIDIPAVASVGDLIVANKIPIL